MQTHRNAGWWPALLVAIGGVLAATPAAAVTVTCGNGSGIAGQTVSIGLTSTDLTGLDVRAYQFSITYNPAVVTAVSVTTAGTLTGAAGWATPTFGVTSGRINVSAAASTPALTGTGVLLYVNFTIDPTLINGSGTGLTLSNFVMNEGTPSVTPVNGSITVNVTPQITVAPNTGEIVKGATLNFSVSGSVAPPVAWSSSNPAIASIHPSTGVLTGVAPGSVRVTALDNAGHTDISDGEILIRGMGVTVGTGNGFYNQSVTIPVTVSSLNGLGVRAGQFSISWNDNYLSFTSATTPPGTMLNGYGSFAYGVTTGSGTATALVDFAGSTDLTGAGTLFNLTFLIKPYSYGGVGLTLNTALFNETLPALRTSGLLTVNAPASFSVNPDNITLLAGATQAFNVSGSPVLPITWSTLDPSVATIHPTSGLLTAVAGGVTRVKATDAGAGVALNTAVTVYDFALTVGTITALPGATAHVPLTSDRSLGGLGIYSTQYKLSWPATYVTSASAGATGMLQTWSAPVTNLQSGSIFVAAAGDHPLLAGGGAVNYVDITTAPGTPVPTDIPLTLSLVLFNEGRPIPLIANGLLRVRSDVGVEGEGGASSFALAAGAPNPAREAARLSFTLPSAARGGERTRLCVYGADGRLVRTVLDGRLEAGRHEVTWDTRDERGAAVPMGLYFYRLEWNGHTLERKLAVLR